MLADSTGNFSAQAAKADNSLAGLLARVRAGTGGFFGIAAGVTGAGVALGLFTATNKAAQAVLTIVAPYDSLTRGLRTLEGTAEKTTRRIETLREVAKTPGLGFQEAIQGDIRLRAVGLSAQASEDSLKAFGNALAIVGGGKADLDSIVLALSKIAAKGKVSAEEINQIAERVPQVRQAMQDAFGTGDAEALGKAGIDATAFISGLVAELGKLPKATGGAQNDLDNYTDAWKTLKAEAASFGTGLAGPWLRNVTMAFGQARRDLGALKRMLGMEDPALQGPDTLIRDREAEAAAALRAADATAEYHRQLANEQAYQEAQANGQKYWDWKEEQAAIAADAAKREQDRALADAQRANDQFLRTTLSPEDYLNKQKADLEKQGPSDKASFDKATGIEKLQIAERAAQIATIEAEILNIQNAQIEAEQRKAEAAERAAQAAAAKARSAQQELALLQAQAQGDTARITAIQREENIRKSINDGLTRAQAEEKENLKQAIAQAQAPRESLRDRLQRERAERGQARTIQKALKDIDPAAAAALANNNRPPDKKDHTQEISKKLDRLDDVERAIKDIGQA